MAERRMGIIAFLFCLCLSLIPCRAQAASTADAKELIAHERDCTLTVAYRGGGVPFQGLPVELYKIAEVSADFQYTLAAPFARSGLILNGVQTAREWNVIRSTLEANIIADGIEADAAAVTDRLGQACFASLKPGLYLVTVERAAQGSMDYSFSSALVSLPGLGEDGLWQYQVEAAAKGEYLPPIEPDEEMQLKVVKLWKGDEGKDLRPKSVEVELFRDGISWKTVILSEDNHWAYSWTAKADGASWTAVERNVPEGYAMTVEKNGTAFVLTNTLITEDPDDPDTPDDPDDPDNPDTPPAPPPPTGDTSNILLYMVLLYLSGMVLIILGMTGKRKRA